jgi:CAAX prenyl protease-like protein
LSREAFSRILPFALFMGFIGLEELVRFLREWDIVHYDGQDLFLYLYPIKALTVGLTLIFFRSKYSEIRLRDLLKQSHTAVSILAGLAVFVLWINMDWPFATFGNPQGFNPTTLENNTVKALMTFSRLTGAVLVVPIMEEIFWRSFLIRYIIKPDFMKTPIGQFTWASFLITSILFGLEHNLYLAGIMAGMAYNLLLYHTKSISHCIIAHAVTNLALGIYVLYTGRWYFW